MHINFYLYSFFGLLPVLSMHAILFGMKLFTRTSMILQQLTRFKLRTIFLGQSVHRIDILRDADLVQVSKGAATERSKARTKDQSNITDYGVGNDTIFQTFGGFVDKSGV